MFPGMEITPETGYDFALQFDCDALKDPDTFLISICEIKQHIFGGPLERAFDALLEKRLGTLSPALVEYRRNEAMYICPSSASKVIVIFLVDFEEATDRVIARVILQEFLEAQRNNRNAPPATFSKDPPGELSKFTTPIPRPGDTAVGFISFSLEERHILGPKKAKAIMLLTGFRTYLHYHIKCSKTYLHMRMRKRVAGWMQVLNRALPDVEGEKKTATGKTFVRK
jgi:actin related protein 2/3 complex subunit 2